MRTFVLLLCLTIASPFVADYLVDRDPPKHRHSVAKHYEPVGYSKRAASELQKLQDDALARYKMTSAVHHKMTTGEKRAVLASLFGVQP